MPKNNINKLFTLERLPLACFFLLALLTQFTLYADFDLWWHLALGKSIVQEGAIYLGDAFSYTFADVRQFRSEWLADLLLYASFGVGGLTGLYVLKVCIILGTLYFVLLAIKEHTASGVNQVVIVAATLVLVLLAIKFRLFIRPYLFSYFFVSVYMYLLSRYDTQGDSKGLYILPVLQLVWSNMQSSAVFGPMLVVLLLVATIIDKDKRGRLKNLLVLFAMVGAASLASPEGFGPFVSLFNAATTSNIQAIGEFQPLTAELLWGYGIRYTYAYSIIVLLSAVYFIAVGGYRRIFYVLVFLLFLVESVRHVRMISFLSIVAAPFAAAGLIYLVGKLRQQSLFASKPALVVTTLLILGLIPATVISSKTYQFGLGIKEGVFPVGALQFLNEQGIEGRMFNSYAFGGYLIWAAPDRKVFIDGRYAHLYPIDFHGSYEHMLASADAWQQAEAQWGFDYAVVEYDQKSQKFPLHLNDNPKWALVYWDNVSAVYLRHSEANNKVIENRQYVIGRPNFYDLGYVTDHYKKSGDLPGLLDALQREINFNPENQEPRLARVMALYMGGKGNYEEILNELDITIGLLPDLSIEHSAAAFVSYNLGDMKRAEHELALALELNPVDYQALALKKMMSEKPGN